MVSEGLSRGMVYLHLTGPVIKVGTADQSLSVSLVKLRPAHEIIKVY